MATMMKEKRKEKKKPKEKNVSRSSINREQPAISNELEVSEDMVLRTTNVTVTAVYGTREVEKEIDETGPANVIITAPILNINQDINTLVIEHASAETEIQTSLANNSVQIKLNSPNDTVSVGNTYQDLNSKLNRMCIPKLDCNLALEEVQDRLENPQAYTKLGKEATSQTFGQIDGDTKREEIGENATPSAPIFDEERTQTKEQHEEIVKTVAPKIQCMPLEDAIRLYGEREMAEVRAMSDREEAIVEAGPVSGPQHPLVDLLSTFRSSLRAVDRERLKLAKEYADEEKLRNSLWKIEKRHVSISENCPCGAEVSLKASYEHAELLIERLPVAKLKLEGLLRDVQDSYCHHQHTALLAHCQIEELISETIKSNKSEIREALALILQALLMSDSAPAALATALQRWAAALSSALLEGRDLRQLLYLLHHLFRQTRSVRWAAKVIRLTAIDRTAAAQTIALLDLLLAKQNLESAVECTEDADASWEEVDERGGGCAVSEGALREHDLLALLHALPLRDLLARLLLLTHCDITKAREGDWGDRSRGRGVLQACCGVRALLAALLRGETAHPHYARLQLHLKQLAARALHGLAGLHLHSRSAYSEELTDRLAVELEACFAAGFLLIGPTALDDLPASLLRPDTVREYCFAFIVGLHDKSPKRLDTLAIELPVLPCAQRVKIVTQAAIDRLDDHELARVVLEFLFQTGIKKSASCKGGCDVTAREQLARLLATHSYLHAIAFHILADLYQVEPLDPSSVDPLIPGSWRPNPAEVKALLEDWSQRCAPLIQHLLMKLDYTPLSGLSLETQLTVGSWLCAFTQQASTCPEWAWLVLRKLRVHRSGWSMPLDAPPPETGPADLFVIAYAVLSSSWGHCIPLICSEGVSALCRLASARVADAVHCLAPVMLVMARSPESVSLTPRFNELFSILLKSGPTMVQRALGLGPEPGAELLSRLIVTQLETDYAGISRSSVLSVWLHALWRVSLPGASAQLEIALLISRDWQLFDSHAKSLLQDKNSTEYISACSRDVSAAPLACECVLRAALTAQSALAPLSARLLDALHAQRCAADRIHVSNALKLIGVNMSADDLVVYRTGAALLAAPLQHPSHLMLWRLFFHLYLQRPPLSMFDSTPPVGPLFFRGIIKSRLLAQIRKKLQETITYHHTEAETYKQKTAEEPQRPLRRKEVLSSKPDDGIVSLLNITDLTGESSDSDESLEEEIEMEREDVFKSEKEREGLLKYHASAEIMCKEMLRWLDEGEKTRAMPHHADVARYIPEQALSVAWERELSRRKPAPLPADSAPPAPPPPLADRHTTPFQKTMANLMKIEDYSRSRVKQVSIKSSLEGVDLRDSRSILALVDTHLADIETLVREWSSEVSRIASLDAALWDAVTSLRVPRPLPPVKRQCPHKCQPVTIHIPHQEWCISTGAERSIKENRRSARALVRRVSRARPHAARSAAALTAVVKYIRSSECARAVLDRAWRCARARAADACPVARAALSSLVQLVADHWVCKDGKLSGEVLGRWCGGPCSALQQTLCGSLVCPQLNHWPAAYCAILHGSLAAHATFSYLSKFEMSRWSSSLDTSQRQQLLEALCTAAQRWGPNPEQEYQVLLELLGVHTACLVSAGGLCAHIVRCARASVACALPAAHWPHITRAASTHATHVSFDQLGHLLRELGVIWWEARTSLKSSKVIPQYAAYSPYIAELLRVLQRAFVAAAVDMSYAPERVALYAWSSLQESWGAWVSPAAGAAPLLPPSPAGEWEWPAEGDGEGQGDAYTAMLKYFLDSVHQVMLDCPGTEDTLLQHIFEWAIQLYMSVKNATSQECRVQMPALLDQLTTLPWRERQWMSPGCLQLALQVCASNDPEIQSWCSAAWRDVTAESWMQGAGPEQIAPLLYLFTAMTQHSQTLEQATRLPWHQLPEAALEQALERFFVHYHNPTQAYHDLPQFRLLLFASELCLPPGSPQPGRSALSRGKRAVSISRWVRAATAPELSDHVPGHSACLLDTITNLAPYIEGSEGEIEELLSRAVIIMCIEPAATAALPVWQRWVMRTTYRLSLSCVSAAAALTTFEHFAALAETAVRAAIGHKESTGWGEISHRWASCHWSDPGPLVARAKLHAAYGVVLTHEQHYSALRTAILALLAANIDFIDNDAIISLWICYICRVGLSSGARGEGGECRAAAGSALLRVGADRGRSLLRLVTLQSDTTQPTDKQRLLARLAQCIINNSEATIRAYEAVCTSSLGSNTDALNWGRTPHPKRLPRLAMRLYPNHDKYFQIELDLAPEDF